VKSGEIKRVYEFGPFRVDGEDRTLWRAGEQVSLTIKAFDTLLVLIEGAGRVIAKEELMEKVWPGSFVEENNLAQQISAIRKALGETESGAPYVETIPKRGYRFSAATRAIDGETAGLIIKEQIRGRLVVEEEIDDKTGPAKTVAEENLLPLGQVRNRKRSAVAVMIAAMLVGLTVLAVFIYVKRPLKPGPSNQPRTLAILPFRNLKQDPDSDFLGISLADAIITKLGYVSTVIVRPSSYVEKYRNAEIDPQKIAAELKVNTLVTGSFIRDGDELRVNAQLVDLESNRILWRNSMDMKYEKVLTVEDRVAHEVINGLSLQLSASENQHLALDAPRDPMAYEYYLRGIDLYSRNEFGLAIEMFRKSVGIDPGYALAWAHLGTAYTATAAFRFGGKEDYQRALAAYRQALQLNPQQMEARIFMANMLIDTNEIVRAVPLLRDVLNTNPNYALAHWELGYAYRFAGVLDESIIECERARALDPQVKLHSSALNSYLYRGQYDQFLNSLPRDDNVAFVVFYRGLARLYLKDEASAAADFDHAYELDPSLYTEIGKAFSHAIRHENSKGLELLQAIEIKMKERGVTEAEAMYKLAQAYALLNDKPAAVRMLDQSVKGGFFCYPYLKDDPLLASVHDDPQYLQILESARRSHEEFTRAFF
jgi:DNA-binding winged helix-turn-helix (wHTH) protein/TolB-like protein/Flp pilus assembly protein TadD